MERKRSTWLNALLSNVKAQRSNEKKIMERNVIPKIFASQ
jgi:hypothetical protein